MENFKWYYVEEVPYYVHCMHTLIHEYLINNGYNSYLSLYSNLDMMGIPVFAKGNNSLECMVNINDPKKLGYKSKEDYLGSNISIDTCIEQEEGLKLLKTKLLNNKSIIVSGSQYYLSYSNNYRNIKYLENYPQTIFGIANHWISVYDIGESEVLVRDAALNYVGQIKLNEFLNFWKGDRFIDGIDTIPCVDNLYVNGYAEINISERLLPDYKKLFLKVLKTICKEYLEGKVLIEDSINYYFGNLALRELSNCLSNIISIRMVKKELEVFERCLLNSKFSRYIFRDLLIESNDILTCMCLNEEITLYNNLIVKLDNIVYMYSVYLARERLDLKIMEIILSKVEELIAFEIVIYEKIDKKLKNINTLER
ncbi:hypothetical protein HZI73_16725 [Vallitalea pronyensis]|uniref:Uncharacterized protein n=1 Tax=Vallitalea pronyensis TaxID=1348613 RepID=A0A8J8MLQ2_9FIRM|nr:hypothetical protein [Vallitalea pronyensis]QUI23836.1 hypothetical protein HZI73_16725 [Vallitalea pronyensis]